MNARRQRSKLKVGHKLILNLQLKIQVQTRNITLMILILGIRDQMLVQELVEGNKTSGIQIKTNREEMISISVEGVRNNNSNKSQMILLVWTSQPPLIHLSNLQLSQNKISLAVVEVNHQLLKLKVQICLEEVMLHHRLPLVQQLQCNQQTNHPNLKDLDSNPI